MDRPYCRTVLECGGGDTAFREQIDFEPAISFSKPTPFESGVALCFATALQDASADSKVHRRVQESLKKPA
jgi:hypothetical protein